MPDVEVYLNHPASEFIHGGVTAHVLSKRKLVFGITRRPAPLVLSLFSSLVEESKQ